MYYTVFVVLNSWSLVKPSGKDDEGGEIHGLEAETTKCAQVYAWYYILFYPADTHHFFVSC
jgi:hypothetical protein